MLFFQPTWNDGEIVGSTTDESSNWKGSRSAHSRQQSSSSWKQSDRSLSNHGRTPAHPLASNRAYRRKERLPSAPVNIDDHSIRISPRPITFEFQTNCVTQIKNLDKRSHFLNSLKNDLLIERAQVDLVFASSLCHLNDFSHFIDERKHQNSSANLLLLLLMQCR